MIIDFGKFVRGEDPLKGLVEKLPRERKTYGPCGEKKDEFWTTFKYSLPRIVGKHVGELEEELAGEGIAVQRTGNRSLWSSSPHPFEVRISTYIEGEGDYEHCRRREKRSDYVLRDKKRRYLELDPVVEEIRGRKKRIVGEKEIPQFIEIPEAYVYGQVRLEGLAPVDISPVLTVLRKQGYESRVTLASERVEKLLRQIAKIKNPQKRKELVRVVEKEGSFLTPY